MRPPVLVRLLPAVVVPAVLVAGCSGSSTPRVQVGPVSRADVTEVVDAPGTVVARATSTVSAPADATVAALLVKDGQRVARGTVLLRLESRAARQRLRQALTAQANSSRSRLTLPQADLQPLQDQLDTAAGTSFSAGRAAAKLVPEPAARARALSAVAVAEARYRAASAAARASIASAAAGVGSVQGALDALSSSQRASAASAVSAARTAVEGLTVRAPLAGVVVLGGEGSGGGGATPDLSGLVDSLPSAVQGQARTALGSGSAGSPSSTGDLAVGSPVRSGAALATVTDIAGLSLAADVDETDVLLVRPGVRADVELDAVPDATYPASVTAVDVAPTTSARGGVSYKVRLALRRGRLAEGGAAPAPRPGMSAVVNLRVRTAPASLSVPSSAVVRDGARSVVFVVRAGRAHRRLVVLGAQGADRDQVLRGVTQGEQVVVRDADRLRDGQAVR